MRVGIYARVSTKHHGQDPDTQLIPLRKFAQAREFVIRKEYVDCASGIKEKRPALDALLEAAKRREIDIVLVWKLDRLGRSLGHLISLLEEFHSLGVQFISFTEGMDTSTASGKLLFNVIGAIASFERDLIRERVRAGLDKAKAKGRKLGRPPKTINMAMFERLKEQGVAVHEIGRTLGISRASAFRVSKTLQSDGGKA